MVVIEKKGAFDEGSLTLELHSMATDSVETSSKPASTSKVPDSVPDRATSEKQEEQVSEEKDTSSPPSEVGEEQPTSAESSAAPSSSAAPAQANHDWQAIWSAPHNAYYFFNSVTKESTWVNPLQPSPQQASGSVAGPSGPGAPGSGADTETTVPQNSSAAAAIAAGIDPDLAYLDPTLAGGGAVGPSGAYAAKFNARTGVFTATNGRDPSHLSEWARAERMSSVFFDTAAYDAEIQARKAEEEQIGKKRKKPTKKDLDRFREQKRLKKIAKTAWLRT